jgi:hypothetical protein
VFSSCLFFSCSSPSPSTVPHKTVYLNLIFFCYQFWRIYMKHTTEIWGWKLPVRGGSWVISPATVALVDITTEGLKYAKRIGRVILNWHQQTETGLSQSKCHLPY